MKHHMQWQAKSSAGVHGHLSVHATGDDDPPGLCNLLEFHEMFSSGFSRLEGSPVFFHCHLEQITSRLIPAI